MPTTTEKTKKTATTKLDEPDWDNINIEKLMIFNKTEKEHDFEILNYKGTKQIEIEQIDDVKQTVEIVKRTQYSFSVKDLEDDEIKTLNILSKKFMLALGNFKPLNGKKFHVEKVGRGFKTEYEVEQLK